MNSAGDHILHTYWSNNHQSTQVNKVFVDGAIKDNGYIRMVSYMPLMCVVVESSIGW